MPKNDTLATIARDSDVFMYEDGDEKVYLVRRFVGEVNFNSQTPRVIVSFLDGSHDEFRGERALKFMEWWG